MDVRHRALIARRSAGGTLEVDLPPCDGTGVAGSAVVESPVLEVHGRSLAELLDRIDAHAGADSVVAVPIDPGDGPAAAVVTVAMVAGARLLVVPSDGASAELARTVRRAADITEALLVERGDDVDT